VGNPLAGPYGHHQPRVHAQERTHLDGAGEPNETEAAYIAHECQRLQDEMLVFGRGGLPTSSVSYVFDGTLKALVNCYQTDPIPATTRNNLPFARTTTRSIGAWYGRPRPGADRRHQGAADYRLE
jgi:hypothetical protein